MPGVGHEEDVHSVPNLPDPCVRRAGFRGMCARDYPRRCGMRVISAHRMDTLVTYLRLTPEFGGTRFGPFEGVEIRLGSNGEQCHIVLPESLGVFPEHVKLVR